MKSAYFFQNLEEQLLDPEVRNDRSKLHDLLAKDFLEFGSSGTIFDREQVIEALLEERPVSRRLLDFVAKEIGSGVVLVTYRSVRRDPETGVERHSLRSSIWKKHDERWQMVFHQGTVRADVS